MSNSPISPADAAAELLKRRHAKRSLTSFIEYISDSIRPAAHHRLLIEHLEAVERGDIAKLMVWMPPGSAKSTYTSVLFPPWYMGRNPSIPVIGVSNTTELAERFSRRARNITADPLYRNVFGFGCSEDTKSAGYWENEAGGEFFAAGIGSAIAGRRAKLGLIDDPIKSREEADSERTRQKHWDWYLNDFETRLMPNAAQIVIQCMVGDTRVLMADGTEKLLRNIKVGDAIASYDKGKIVASKVLNWANQGCDRVLLIRTKSGKIVVANERHPFLVERDGVQGWIRVQDLQIGDRMLCAEAPGKDAPAPNARNPQEPRATVIRTTTRRSGQADTDRHRSIRSLGARLTCGIDTVLTWISTMPFWLRKVACAPSVGSHQGPMFALTGAKSSASTTTMSLARFAVCSATTATWQLATAKQNQSCAPPLTTYEIAPDEIVLICDAGSECVFDIQVERTENFIANGTISHNTRWHEDDLSGRILQRAAADWTVLKLPMIAQPQDPLGRAVGERLWPEWFTDAMVTNAQHDMRAWNALYQQDPAPDDGVYFERDMFGTYKVRPKGMHIYGASDYAVTEGGGDYTEHGVFGLDYNGDLHILDWWRGQTASAEWIERQCDLILQWKPLTWFGESGPIRRAIEPFLKRRMEQRRAHCRLEWLSSIADKPTRARAFQGLASMGKVYLPEKAIWLSELFGQLMKFPAGKYDDGVDVCSLIGRGLEMAKAPEMPEDTQPVMRSYPREQGWMG